MSEDTIPGQLSAIQDSLLTQDKRLVLLEKAVEDNTELTKDIKEALVAGKFFTKIVKWGGGVAAAVSAIYVSYTHIKK